MPKIVATTILSLFIFVSPNFTPLFAQECEPFNEHGRSFSVDMMIPVPQNLQKLDARIEIVPSEFPKLISKLNSGDLPDAIVLGGQHIESLAERGDLAKLDAQNNSFEPFLSDSQMLMVGDDPYALPLFATSRVWVIRQDIAEKLGLDADFESQSAFEFLDTAKQAGYHMGLDYGNGNSAAADYLSVFNGLSNSGSGSKTVPKFDSKEGLEALEVLKKLSEYSNDQNVDSHEIAAGFVKGEYIAMSAWAHTADHAFRMASDTHGELSAVVVAPPLMSPNQSQNIPIYWYGLVFTHSIGAEDMKFVYCQIQNLFDPKYQGEKERRPLQWTKDGLVWSKGGEGVISAFGRGASYVPGGAVMLSLENGLSDVIPQALADQSNSPEGKLNQIDSLVQRDFEQYGGPSCVKNKSCFTLIPESFIWKTGGGNTCSTSACSSGQYCCDGKCQNKPCEKKK